LVGPRIALLIYRFRQTFHDRIPGGYRQGRK
jgi:hypothetical protein